MAKLEISRLAEADLLAIGEHTLEHWGAKQAERYLQGLQLCCEQLARQPELGRQRDDVKEHMRSHVYERHMLYYRVDAASSEVLIVRILHQSMLPTRHLNE
jgi:toxin ParE1/3/4